MLENLRRWAREMRRDVLALYLAARDPRVPRVAKILAIATAAYALSPIDLIPDFIPVLGYLDDLVILPLAIYWTVRLIPADVMADLRREALAQMAAGPKSMAAAAVIVAIWIALALAATYAITGAY